MGRNTSGTVTFQFIICPSGPVFVCLLGRSCRSGYRARPVRPRTSMRRMARRLRSFEQHIGRLASTEIRVQPARFGHRHEDVYYNKTLGTKSTRDGSTVRSFNRNQFYVNHWLAADDEPCARRGLGDEYWDRWWWWWWSCETVSVVDED